MQGQVAQASGPGGADAVLGPGPQPMTELEFGNRPVTRRAFFPEAARVSMSRETVGAEATGPNTAGSARSMATSARQSLPSATARATSISILPGSCTA